MSTVQTPSGKILPLMNLKGKDYLAVAYRLVWYREIFPKGRITTEAVQMTQEYAVFRASIFDESGNLLATATKHESKKDFPDHIEKAETGAIGRALALCGFGTQFTDELDEGERIVDSPIAPRPSQTSPIAPKTTTTPRLVSEAQVKYFQTMASRRALSIDQVKSMLASRFGVDSCKNLTMDVFNDALAALNAMGDVP